MFGWQENRWYYWTCLCCHPSCLAHCWSSKSQSTQNTSHQRLLTVSDGVYAKERPPLHQEWAQKLIVWEEDTRAPLQGKLLHVGKQNNGRTTAYVEQKICAMWSAGRGALFNLLSSIFFSKLRISKWVSDFLPIRICWTPTYKPGILLGIGGRSNEQKRQRLLLWWSLH